MERIYEKECVRVREALEGAIKLHLCSNYPVIVIQSCSHFLSEIKKWISAITSQKPGLWFADLVGQPIRGLVFGVKLPEFLSQSQIKGDYNFSILVLEIIYNPLWELEAIGLWVNFIVGGSWWWWWWWKWLGFMHLILCCFSPWCCKVTNKFRDLTEKCMKYYTTDVHAAS